MSQKADSSSHSPTPVPGSQDDDGLTRREILKAGTLGVFGGLDALAAASAATPESSRTPIVVPLVFDEPHDRLPGNVDWPVTVGIPFANGVLENCQGLSISRANTVVPTQINEALRWRFGPKTVSWAHCDFQCRIGQGVQPATVCTERANVSPTAAVVVADRGTHYQVDTGAISFTCSKSKFNLFDSFVAGDKHLVKGSSLYWKDTRGQVYEGQFVVSHVEVEKSGPMRAVLRYEGWYQRAGGKPQLRYMVWIHAFAGLPYVRIYNKLIWTENLTLYVAIDTASSALRTSSLFADRIGSPSYLAHGWSTGDAVKWAYSHSDTDASGQNQYYDNTSKAGNDAVVLPKVDGPPLDRERTYFVRVKDSTTLTLHRTEADALNGAGPIKFLDSGTVVRDGVNLGGRHYLAAQHPTLAEWGVRFQLAAPATQASVDVDRAATAHIYALSSSRSITAQQVAYGRALLTPGAGAPAQAHSLAGWADARFADGAGLAVAVKALAQQIPKEIVVDEHALTVKLWGGRAMSLREEDRVLSDYQKDGYPKEWLAFSGEPNPVGISKTHEVWVWPTQSEAQNRLINDLVQRPVACCADPTYACATDYLIGLRARSQSPESYRYVEDSLENMWRFLTAREDKHADFDEWNFGDLRLFRNGPFRTWDNGGYNGCDLFWWQWFRTGRRFFLEEGINNSRHVMDVDTMAHSQQLTGNNNYQRIAGRVHNFATLQWGWPCAFGDGFVDHPAYLLLCWLMTGYEVARSVLETKCEERKASDYGTPGNLSQYNLAAVSREKYGAILPKFVYYEFQGDEKFYASGRDWLELAMRAQAASKETNGNGTRMFPNNNFWGFFYEAFLYAYRHAGETSVLTALAQTVDEFAVSPASHFDAPTFRCTWPSPSRLNRTRYNLVRFAAAYKRTGDLRYLQYPAEKVLRQCRTVQPAGAFLGYDVIDGILATGFIRGALPILGALADAGFPPIRWPGNMPLFGSQEISANDWCSQLTLWVQKRANTAGKVRLIFKDANLSALEAPGRVQVVILNPAGATSSLLLTKDSTYPATINGSSVSLSRQASLMTGQAVRLGGANALPKPFAADTTYFARLISNGATTKLTLHRDYAEARGGVNPIAIIGSAASLSLIVAQHLSEATFTLPASGPAGDYRILVQAESQLFRVFPASDMPGLVVELPGLSDLSVSLALGPSEYFFRMRAGRTTLALNMPPRANDVVRPVVVLDLENRPIGRFDYDGGKTLAGEISIPAAQLQRVLKLAKGYEEFSTSSPDALPYLRLGGAERYLSVTPSQWFRPRTAFGSAVAAFWSMDEQSGIRHDSTDQGRDLQENHGPILCDHDGPLGCSARFTPPANSFLSSDAPVFQPSNSFTVWGWVRLDQFDDSRYLFVKGGDLRNNPQACEWAIYALPTPTRRIHFQARVGRRFAFTRPMPFEADSHAHFVIGWYDAKSQQISLQVDHGPIVSQALGGPINVGNAPFCVGGSAANGCGWIGAISAVGYANSVLTELERNLLFNGGSGMHYPF